MVELDRILSEYPLLEQTPYTDMEVFRKSLDGQCDVCHVPPVAVAGVHVCPCGLAVITIDFVNKTMNKLEIDVDPGTMLIERRFGLLARVLQLSGHP